MVRYINGLRFIVRSPSHYVLDASNAVVRASEIFFDGEFWVLRAQAASGFTYERNFVSRDTAFGLLSGRNS
jgi:hypothetical protein